MVVLTFSKDEVMAVFVVRVVPSHTTSVDSDRPGRIDEVIWMAHPGTGCETWQEPRQKAELDRQVETLEPYLSLG